MSIKFHKHMPEIANYRKDPEWKEILHGLSPSECCLAVAQNLSKQKQGSRALNLMVERLWWEYERPYYNLWPSVLQMIRDVSLDVPMRCLKLPYSAMAVCFPEDTKEGLASFLVSVDKGIKREFLVNITANVFVGGEAMVVWRWGQVDGDEPFTVFANCRDNPKDWKRHGVGELSEEQESSILKLVCHVFCGVAILANDPTIVQPIVLNRDMLKYRSSDEATKKYLEDRAARINGRGFGVGEGLESELKSTSVSPHVRKPHMALFWTGKGRTVPVLQLRRGAFIHPAEATEVPTGYMGKEEANSIDPSPQVC